jgi:hypothetical protein
MSLQLGLHHFNHPSKENSYKGDNEVLHQIRKRFGAEQCGQTFKDKWMQTQCEVKFI